MTQNARSFGFLRIRVFLLRVPFQGSFKGLGFRVLSLQGFGFMVWDLSCIGRSRDPSRKWNLAL